MSKPSEKRKSSLPEPIDKLVKYIDDARAGALPDVKVPHLLEMFSNTLEELQVMTEELHVQNEVLEFSQRQAELDRQRYQDLFEYAPDGYLVTDLFGKIEEANIAAAELFGVATKNLRMKPLTIYLHKEDRPTFFRILKEFSCGKINQCQDLQLRIQPREKDLVVVSVSIRAVDPDVVSARPVLRWILKDITKRHSQEIQLSQSARSLSEKNAELEQWAAVTAHDLKEPMRVMALYSELLRERYEGVLEGDGETYLSFISSAANKGLSLIQDLLTFHSLGSKRASFKSVKLSQPLKDAVETVRPSLSECDGEIICGKMPTVLGDSSQLSQLFYNLLSNSIKFRSPDRPLVIRVDAVREEDRWVVLVQDNGIGFDLEYAERIFILFERLNSAELFQGNGIGLALCKKIAENHSGEISAISVPCEGTTMKVWFPYKSPRQLGD